MNTYTITLKHDAGNYKVTVYAHDEVTAKDMVCKAESCPIESIIKIKAKVTMYKVVKLFRVSGRRQVLERGLTESEAQRVVNRYPDSNRSMVLYLKQFSA